MRIDPEDIRRRFAALDDEELSEVERGELSELAQQIFDEVCAGRQLSFVEEAELPLGDADGSSAIAGDAELDDEARPEWMEDGVCVCTFEASPGSAAVGDVAKARAVLLAADIPCSLAAAELPPQREGHPPRKEVSLFVPGALHLHASGVLDRDLFNATHEEEWQRHFEAISDEDLLALRPEIFTAGLLDRVARMKRVHASEVERRGLKR